jgi:hypothetical protein
VADVGLANGRRTRVDIAAGDGRNEEKRMDEARLAWSKLMGLEVMMPLSPVARVCFVVVAAGLTATAVALFVVDLITYASSTGALVFVVLPFYAALAYGVILAVDFAVRLGARAIRRF